MISSRAPVHLQSAAYHDIVAELRRPAHGTTTLVTLWGGPPAAQQTAARQLAAALGRSVLPIDLASVVSKYMGETEKNLNQLFSRAEHDNAILLFDEADALFGDSRTEVKDAHDRYATLELVRRSLERHRGIAVVLSAATAGSSPPASGHKKVRRVWLKWPPG